MAVKFASGVGPCVGIVEPFKCVLRVANCPQFWRLSCDRPWALVQGGRGTIRGNCEGLHTKGRLDCCCTSLLHHFIITSSSLHHLIMQCHFFRSHVGHGHQLVGVWSNRYTPTLPSVCIHNNTQERKTTGCGLAWPYSVSQEWSMDMRDCYNNVLMKPY